jgi:hypothetical protein
LIEPAGNTYCMRCCVCWSNYIPISHLLTISF